MKWVRIRDLEHNQRFWILTSTNLIAGSAAILINNVFKILPPSGSVVKSVVPGSYTAFGGILFALGFAGLIARFIDSKVMRVVHSLAVGYYLMLASLVTLAIFFGSPYSFIIAPYFFICSWMHYRAAIESEPLKFAPSKGVDDGN